MWRLLQPAYPGYGPYYGGGYGGGPYYNRPYYGGYPGSVTVEVGDRPYYVHGAWLLSRPHLLRLETRTLGSAERAASLDPRPLRHARRILIEQPRSGGFPAAVGDLEIALP